MTMKRIAVLLTVFNRKEATLRCLESIRLQKMPSGCSIDIYLTNDGCTDGTVEAVSEEYPEVYIVKGSGELFWNRGMYKAWEVAALKDYDFYLWLNDDTFVYEKMISCLIENSALKNDQAIIVGVTRSLDHMRSTYGGRLADNSIPQPLNQLIPIHHFNGNIVLVPRYVYTKLGNLDPYYWHSKGDFDYGLRAAKMGIPMYQVGEYLGECELHPTIDKWCDPKVPIAQRWKALKRPNGMPPNEIFYMNYCHKNLFNAIIHYLLVYIRCIVPQLWSRRNNKLFQKK